MAPMPRREWPGGFNPARIRDARGPAAGFPADETARPPRPHAPQAHLSADDSAHVVLTVRADTLGRHAARCRCRAASIDPGETFEQAALREAHEEVGLAQDRCASSAR